MEHSYEEIRGAVLESLAEHDSHPERNQYNDLKVAVGKIMRERDGIAEPRSHDCRQLHQRLAANGLALVGQNMPLAIGEEDPPPAHLVHEDPDLGVLELDDLLLLAVDPAREYQIRKKSCQGEGRNPWNRS